MSRGIGVRYSGRGLRALMVERTGIGVSVVDVAAGPWDGDVRSFLADRGFDTAGSGIAVGLVPGDFLSASMIRGGGMDDREVEEQLRWELERKMLSPRDRHSINFALVNDAGFIFSGRKEQIGEFLRPDGKPCIVDVEPIALYNGCEGAGEVGDGLGVLASVEADGISCVLVENGLPRAIDSFSLVVEDGIGTLPDLASARGEWRGHGLTERFAGQIADSLPRLLPRGGKDPAVSPGWLVLAGSGACIGELAGLAEETTGIPAAIADPFASLRVDMAVESSDLTEMGAAFTTCFGLALRAMEE